MKAWVIDISGVAGGGLITYGAWLIYPPAGYITSGALLIAAAILIAQSASPARRP